MGEPEYLPRQPSLGRFGEAGLLRAARDYLAKRAYEGKSSFTTSGFESPQ